MGLNNNAKLKRKLLTFNFKLLTCLRSRGERGFTLLEILVVVSIIALIYVTALIGYDALRERARKNSALAVATTVMKELLVCADSGGYGITGSAPTVGTTYICCDALDCTGNTAQAGHTAKWPDLGGSGGGSRWQYGDGTSAPSGSLTTNPPTYTYYLANFDGTKTISCVVANKKCQ